MAIMFADAEHAVVVGFAERSAPEQVVPGDGGLQIAQIRHGGGLLRVVFFSQQDLRRIVTLYWTSRVDKYRKEP